MNHYTLPFIDLFLLITVLLGNSCFPLISQASPGTRSPLRLLLLPMAVMEGEKPCDERRSDERSHGSEISHFFIKI